MTVAHHLRRLHFISARDSAHFSAGVQLAVSWPYRMTINTSLKKKKPVEQTCILLLPRMLSESELEAVLSRSGQDICPCSPCQSNLGSQEEVSFVPRQDAIKERRRGQCWEQMRLGHIFTC